MLRAVERDQRCIHGITWPAERRGTQGLADISSGLPGADGRDHLLANRVFLGGVSMAHRLERVVGAIASTFDDSRPRGAVGFLKVGEHSDKSVIVCRLDAFIKRREQDFVAAALENLGVGYDFTDQAVTVADGAGLAAVHALTCFLSLRPRRIAPRIEGLLRRIRFHDQAAQVVRRLTGNEDMNGRAVGSGRPRCIGYVLL